MLAIGAVIGAGIFGAIGTAAAGQIGPDGEVIRYGAGPGAGLLVPAARRRLRARGALLRGARAMIPQAGQRLRLLLRDARRAGRVDHRLGPDPRVRGRQRRGRDLVGRLLHDAAARLRRQPAGVADDRLPHGAAQLRSRRFTACSRRRRTSRGIPILVNVPAFAHRDADHLAAAARRARERDAPTTSWWSIKLLVLALFVVVGVHAHQAGQLHAVRAERLHAASTRARRSCSSPTSASTRSRPRPRRRANPQRNLPIGILGGLAICTRHLRHRRRGAHRAWCRTSELGRSPTRWRTRSNVAGLHTASAGSSRSARSSRWRRCCWCSSTASRASSSRWRATACCRSGRRSVHREDAHAVRRRRSSPACSSRLASLIGDADETYDLTNIGTLFAFVLVCIGVLVLRVNGAGPAAAVPGAVRLGRGAARRRGVRVHDGRPAATGVGAVRHLAGRRRC